MKNTGCLRICIALLAITGVWQPRGLKKRHHLLLYCLYAGLIQAVCFFGIVIIELYHLMLVFDDIEKATECSLLLLSHLAEFTKTVTIWWRQERIKQLLDLLESSGFNRGDPDKKTILEDKSKLAYFVSKALSYSTLGTALMWGVFPLLKMQLELPLSFPYMTSDSPMFMIFYAYQLSGITFCAMQDTAEDFLTAGLMILASAQLDLLIYELNNIGSTSGDQDFSSITRNEDAIDVDYNNAISCVKYHQQIITFVDELDDIFGAHVFCQFTATSLIMCFTAFKITFSKEPMEIITMVLYLTCITVELFLYCYSGNMMKETSQLVAEAAYNNNWANTSVQTQRTLLMLTLRAQRPLSINAGKMFHMSLATFTVILKSSYSYFALLSRYDYIGRLN